uniref:Uncharacterized protein n=1 Tax=Rhodnius prolixus TaxID=13249 RepID=T1HJ18_RHOPR
MKKLLSVFTDLQGFLLERQEVPVKALFERNSSDVQEAMCEKLLAKEDHCRRHQWTAVMA